MKKLLVITICTLATSVATSSTRGHAAPTRNAPHQNDARLLAKAATKTPAKTTRSTTFLVDGMTCINCSKGLTQALLSLKGVRSARVDLATKRAAIVFDSRHQSVQKLRAFIAQNGFKATPFTSGASSSSQKGGKA